MDFHGNIDGKSWQEPGQELLRPVGGREDGRPWAMGKAAQTERPWDSPKSGGATRGFLWIFCRWIIRKCWFSMWINSVEDNINLFVWDFGMERLIWNSNYFWRSGIHTGEAVQSHHRYFAVTMATQFSYFQGMSGRQIIDKKDSQYYWISGNWFWSIILIRMNYSVIYNSPHFSLVS